MKHVIDYFEEKIYGIIILLQNYIINITVPYYSKVPETHNEQL
jgi:hypothetical protein